MIHMQSVIVTAKGKVITSNFTNQANSDPVAEHIAAIMTNPIIRRPVKLIAVFDDGETITWTVK